MAGGSKIKESGTLVEGIRLHKLCLRDLHKFAKSYRFDFEEHKAWEKLRIRQAETLQLHISRLLYSNSDISRQEKLLILFVLDASSLLKSDNIFEDKPRIWFDSNHNRLQEYFKNVDPSPPQSQSDMADSGLETGSSLFGTQETSPSENSGTDLDDQSNNAISTNGEAGAYDKSNGDSSLNDYEAENEQNCVDAKNNASSIFLKCSNYSKKSNSNSREDLVDPGIAEEQEVKNYYFIDASSLNDDADVIAPDPAEFAEELNAKLSDKVATAAEMAEDDLSHPEIRIDPIVLEQDDDVSLHKSSNKESLIVEIKETDSGESNSHSPCPDNTDIVATAVSNDVLGEHNDDDDKMSDGEEKPKLVRRNTFEFEADDEKLAMLRQEYERQQEIEKNNSCNDSGIQDSTSNFTSDTENFKSLDNAQSTVKPEKCSSEKFLANVTNESSTEDFDDNSCTSLPVTLSIQPAPRSPQKPVPMVRRKSDTCPLEKIHKTRPKPLKLSSSLTAWVVDMSDCGEKTSKKESSPPKGGMGYFVNIEGSSESKRPHPTHRRHQSFAATSSKQGCEFFVDLSDKSPLTIEREAKSTNDIDKKNMFSMFIELNEGATPDAGKSSAKLAEKRLELQNRLSHKVKPSLEVSVDSPVVRRRTMSNSRLQPFKRHSWNTDKSEESNVKTPDKAPPIRYEHKRAHSLSVERPSGDFRKFLGVKLTQSMSDQKSNVDKNGNSENNNGQQSSLENVDYDFRDTPPNSHVEIINEELMISAKKHNYHPEDDCSENSNANKTVMESPDVPTRKSETFNISTSSTAVSSGSDSNDFQITDLTFDQKSKLQNSAENNLESLEIPKSLADRLKKSEGEFNKYNNRNNSDYNGKNNHHYGDKPSKIATLTRSDSEKTSENFVKLADLDKVSIRSHSSSSSSIKDEKISRFSVKNTVKSKPKLVGNAGFRSFSRKFSSNMTTSLPSRMKTDEDLATEGDTENVVSESDISSIHSSMGRSGNGSTEETETSTSFAIGKPYNRLGEDLLRMFVEQVNTDVIIDVSGQQIRAHKCILSSRCQYFAAILSGGWIESSGNLISLQGYSFNSVHFALCHIYSGESYIPDSIDIVELASLADMLCLEGLKEVIGFTLKVKYCHLFHKPCNVCTVGVIGCMPLAAACGLDEVYRKSLRWIMKHFVRIWPSKEFATLPRELMDKCYQQHIIYMSPDNVLQTIMDCNKLLATIPNVRWAEPVFQLGSNLLDASMKYLTDHFAGVLTSEQLQRIGFDQTWNVGRLEDHLMAAADRLGPEQACRSYTTLHKMLNSTTNVQDSYRKIRTSALLTELLTKIYGRVEKCLVREAARAARTSSWLKMDLELRRKIQELACLVIVPTESNKRPSRHSTFLKDGKDLSLESAKAFVDRSNVTRNLDLRRVKAAITEYAADKPNIKQTPLLQTRKVMNKPKSDPLERKSKNDYVVKSLDNIHKPQPRPYLNKSEVKSRYLEPRIRPQPAKESPSQQDKVIVQQRKKIMISSSDSSRTSSPATRRAADKKQPLVRQKLTINKDIGKAHSSDSLSDNFIKSKSLGITRPESPKHPKKSSASDIVKSPSMSRVVPSIMKTSSIQKTTASASSPQLSTIRRPARSLESSTAASRSRTAAALSIYHPSQPNLRKNLLEAAKTPDIPNKSPLTASNGSFRSSVRKKQDSNNCKLDKSSPSKVKTGKAEKLNNSKVKSETPEQQRSKLLSSKRSRSNTFSKDEPTVLDKTDLVSAEINV